MRVTELFAQTDGLFGEIDSCGLGKTLTEIVGEDLQPEDDVKSN